MSLRTNTLERVHVPRQIHHTAVICRVSENDITQLLLRHADRFRDISRTVWLLPQQHEATCIGERCFWYIPLRCCRARRWGTCSSALVRRRFATYSCAVVSRRRRRREQADKRGQISAVGAYHEVTFVDESQELTSSMLLFLRHLQREQRNRRSSERDAVHASKESSHDIELRFYRPRQHMRIQQAGNRAAGRPLQPRGSLHGMRYQDRLKSRRAQLVRWQSSHNDNQLPVVDMLALHDRSLSTLLGISCRVVFSPVSRWPLVNVGRSLRCPACKRPSREVPHRPRANVVLIPLFYLQSAHRAFKLSLCRHVSRSDSFSVQEGSRRAHLSRDAVVVVVCSLCDRVAYILLVLQGPRYLLKPKQVVGHRKIHICYRSPGDTAEPDHHLLAEASDSHSDSAARVCSTAGGVVRLETMKPLVFHMRIYWWAPRCEPVASAVTTLLALLACQSCSCASGRAALRYPTCVSGT
ncbi:hypothetical protein KC361_g32 [Hortaea werneckii]|nr:hypothetical protein KC361_g32 [Hortaea werneckii]